MTINQSSLEHLSLNLKVKNIQQSTIYFKSNFFDNLEPKINTQWNEYSALFMVIDKNLRKNYFKKIKQYFKNISIPKYYIFIHSSEDSKSLSMVNKIIQFMLKKKLNRACHCIVFGGGVLSDLAGFICGIYHRGIDFSIIPSTFLSQIDSAIGGKTSINVSQYGKNLMGLIKFPKYIIIDMNVLKSLSNEHFNYGISELIKYFIICNLQFLHELLHLKKELKQKNPKFLQKWIFTACKIKLTIVHKDPYEQNLRKILNFGHTIGHALEKASNYQYHHGEALSLGLLIELSINKAAFNKINQKSINQIKAFLSYFNLPIQVPEWISNQQILDALIYDKKIDYFQTKTQFLFIKLKRLGKINKKNITFFVNKKTIEKHLNQFRCLNH